MEKETRTAVYDSGLNIEAYRLKGVVQPFPNHFHDHYVVGLIESGTRSLTCKNVERTVKQGDILLFNPGDNHGCAQCDNMTMDYRGLNIPAETMRGLSERITGDDPFCGFAENVISDSELERNMRCLHEIIMRGGEKTEKEQMLLLFASLLIERYRRQRPEIGAFVYDKEIEFACSYIEENYARHITLDELCKCSSASSSTLLRAFIKTKGVTPYRYLQSVRINKAKTLLENGCTPTEAALQTGFTDQSHFTNFFRMFIGLSPAAYRRIFKDSEK